MLLTCHSLPACGWATAPLGAPPGLGAEVLVYRVAVAENQPHVPRLWALLTAAEQQRAHRYHFAADYHRFVVSRAVLRLLLGRHLGQPPAALRFELGENKKPRLAPAPALHYNVSHAGSWVLLALASVEVGVDVERLDPAFAFQEVLDYSCTPAERAFVARSAAPHHAFYQLWTRKEAFVKATGRGIDAALSHVPVLDGAHQLPGPGGAAGWVVSSFAAAPGHVGAVAYPAAPGYSLRFYDLGNELLGALLAAAAH